MPVAVPAVEECLRLETLHGLEILDTPAEERFDRLTRLARRLFDVPMALVTLVDADRLWLKSGGTRGVSEYPRDRSFCARAIQGDDVLLIRDASIDPVFHDNPFVTGEPGVRFYAGCPLRVSNGSKLGTFCLIDTRPRSFSADENALLQDLARMAEREIVAFELAAIDELTLLSNRRGFLALANKALRRHAAEVRPSTLLFFDLDGFKAVNDRHGHAEGDRAIVAFSRLLVNALRSEDIVGRLGGDEFVALLAGASLRRAHEAVNRLRAEVVAYNAQSGLPYALRFSVGMAEHDGGTAPEVGVLLTEADQAMYAQKQAKAQG